MEISEKKKLESNEIDRSLYTLTYHSRTTVPWLDAFESHHSFLYSIRNPVRHQYRYKEICNIQYCLSNNKISVSGEKKIDLSNARLEEFRVKSVVYLEI